MDDLIKVFNSLHEINKHLKLNAINLPQIVVIGTQSSGKSSVLESIVGCDFLPKGVGTVTRCPLRLQLINDGECGELRATFGHSKEVFTTFKAIMKEIEMETQRRTAGNNSIGEEEIVLDIVGPNLPTLTFVDLPGFLKVTLQDQPTDLEKRIENLARKYISSENSIILVITPANVDIVTSEGIKLAREYDPEGLRTYHVLTKLDLMDAGTNAYKLLTDSNKLKSQGVIGVVNRSQQGIQSKMAVEIQRQNEEKFLNSNYSDISNVQGTKYLVETLVYTLKEKLKQYQPKLKRELNDRIQELRMELSKIDPKDSKETIINCHANFYETIRKILDGSLDEYGDDIEGGAKISVELYEVFYRNMQIVTIDEITEAAILKALKNTGGVRDMNFALDKAFSVLMRKQIEKCLESSELSLEIVRDFLIEFSDEAMEKSNIVSFPELKTEYDAIIKDVIMDRWQKTKEMIGNYILCEKNSITFTNPYINLLQDMRNYPLIPNGQLYLSDTRNQQPMHSAMQSSSSYDDGKLKKSETMEDIAAKVTKMGLNLPVRSYYPHIFGGMEIAGHSDVYERKLGSGDIEPTRYVMDVINQGIGLEARRKEICDFVARDYVEFNKQFLNWKKPKSLNDSSLLRISSSSEMQNESPASLPYGKEKISISGSQGTVIKRLLDQYFNTVRANIINYVPKVIQTFLVKDLWQELRIQTDKRISLQFADDYVSNSQEVCKMNAYRNDLEKLEDMKKKFNEKW